MQHKPEQPPRSLKSSKSTRNMTGKPPLGSSSDETVPDGVASTASKPSTPLAPLKASSRPSTNDERDRLVAAVDRWREDFSIYCREALTIKAKDGQLLPFTLNRAQLHLHRLLEEQRARTGMVRAVVLKGRQQGVSTYVQARFYWRTSLGRGKNAYILTHRVDASEKMFGMAERFHQNAPIKPSVGAANAKELIFDKLDSSYQVATAGAKGTGRSGTAQLFHGSEVAFWPNADDHLSGIGQVVARIPGTEIIYESTANGIGNVFHDLWTQAESGNGDLIAVFIPWFWEPGYTADPGPDFSLTDDEESYRSAYGLTMGQMAWRRLKVADDFNGDPSRFAQEYPATPSEAFTAVNHDPFIRPDLVLSAVGRRLAAPTQDLIVGVDPARFGDAATAIARRRGRHLVGIERIRKQDTMAVAGRIVTIIRDEKPRKVFVDLGGLGAGVYDRLVELGYAGIVMPVNFGETANKPDRFVNRRAEMWSDMRDWLAGGSIPKDDELMRDLSGPKFSWDSEGRLKLEKKEDMRARKVASPDSADALGLTFALPVAAYHTGDRGSSAWEDSISERNEHTQHDEAGGLGVHTG